MMIKVAVAVLGVALFCSSNLAHADSHVQKHEYHVASWGYDGEAGPSKWGEIDAEYQTCSEGKNQSPIDIAATVEADLGAIRLHYKDVPLKLINNGHTVQANYSDGSYISIDGVIFHLLQFHFHSPSEHHFSGATYAMEVHFVHKDDNGNLAVVAVMLNEGRVNPFIDILWDNLPTVMNKEDVVTNVTINGTHLWPENKEYYRYNGSLTTPPCSEGVRWMVMKTPVEISKGQVKRFLSLIDKNARPTQTVNARVVLR